MNLKTKKIIAREFILLLVCFAIAILTFFMLYLFNSFNEGKINRMSSQIEIEKKIADSLEQTILKKAQLVVDEAKKLALKNTKQPVIETTRHNMLPPKRPFPKTFVPLRDNSKGLGNAKYTPSIYTDSSDEALDKYQANEAIDNDASISPKEKLKLKADLAKPKKLQAQLTPLRSKIIYFDEQIKISAIAFFISLFGIFFLRCLFYSIKWSLRTLNEK